MFSIIKNICRILLKRKGFIITAFVLPIVLSSLFMSLNSSGVDFNIAVINNDKGKLGQVIEDRLSEMEGVKIINIDENDDYKQKLSFHNYEMVLKMDEDFTDKVINGSDEPISMYAINQSDYRGVLENTIENEIKSLSKIAANVDVTDDNIDKIIDEYNNNKPELTYSEKDKKVNIKNAFGLIIYIMVISASMVCEYTLEDEKNNTKTRIIMSKISEKTYLAAQCIIYFILSAIPAIEYYFICKSGNYDIGFSDDYQLLIILLCAVLLGVVFNMFLTSIIKKKQVYSLLSATALVPVFMISGAFWDFEFMSSTLQKIGNLLPPRWLMIALDKLQKGEGFESIIPMLLATILLSAVLFLLSILFTRNKIVLVKDQR